MNPKNEAVKDYFPKGKDTVVHSVPMLRSSLLTFNRKFNMCPYAKRIVKAKNGWFNNMRTSTDSVDSVYILMVY